MRLITLCEVLFIAAVVYQAVQWRYTGIAIHLCKMQERGVDGVAGGGYLPGLCSVLAKTDQLPKL